jgi:hypothetical protein
MHFSLFPPFLDKGSKDEPSISLGPVRFLQLLLISYECTRPSLTPDGEYGDETAEAVQVLQRRLGFKGVEVDGNFGPGTREALRVELNMNVRVLRCPANIPVVVMYKFPDSEELKAWPEAQVQRTSKT